MSSSSGPSSRSAMRAASGSYSSRLPAARRASTASPSPSPPATARPCSASRSSRSYSLRPGSIRYAASSVSKAGTTPASASAPPKALKLWATSGLAPAASAGVASLSGISSAWPPRAMPSSPSPSPARPTGPPSASSERERRGVAALGAERVLLALDHGTRDGCLELVDAAQQRAELEAAEQLPHGRPVGRIGQRLREVDVELQVALDRGQLLGALRLLAVLDQRLAPLLAGHGIHVRVDALQRAEAHEQLRGRLVADAGNAGDVVGGVALEPDEVGHEPRRNAVARLDALGRVDVHVRHAARREQHADVVGHELEGVAIVRDHAGGDPLLVRAQAQRADHVVGLVALELHVAVPERLDQRAQVGLLLLEQRRRRLARGLVAREALQTVHGPRVPGHDHALRVVVGEQAHEHVGEAEQCIRREALGRRELLGQRVVGPVGE